MGQRLVVGFVTDALKKEELGAVWAKDDRVTHSRHEDAFGGHQWVGSL
jgi:hypothetical protein